MGTEYFIAEGVSHVELLAYQVSMVCAGNWPRYLYLSCVYDVISLLNRPFRVLLCLVWKQSLSAKPFI